MAISRLHISSQQFFELSPAEYFAAMTDQQERERAGLEIIVHNTWEAARMVIYHEYKRDVNIKKGEREKLKPEDIMGFVWEKKAEKKQTIEEQKKVLLTIASTFKKKKNKEQRKNVK